MSPRRDDLQKKGGAIWKSSVYRNTSMMFFVMLSKIALVLFMLGWLGFAGWMLLKFESLFGYRSDETVESSGARTLNQTQVWSCWLGVFVLAGWFLFS